VHLANGIDFLSVLLEIYQIGQRADEEVRAQATDFRSAAPRVSWRRRHPSALNGLKGLNCLSYPAGRSFEIPTILVMRASGGVLDMHSINISFSYGVSETMGLPR
jgi:hypothetical protein